MSTYNTIVNSIAFYNGTSLNIRWSSTYDFFPSGIKTAQVVSGWSHSSFPTTVCTAIASVFLFISHTLRNPMQTIKHCTFAVPTVNEPGAVGFPFQGANHTVVDVERLSKTSLRKFNFGKV